MATADEIKQAAVDATPASEFPDFVSWAKAVTLHISDRCAQAERRLAIITGQPTQTLTAWADRIDAAERRAEHLALALDRANIEVAELRRDKERLDWLSEHGWCENYIADGEYDLRAAIDAAREGGSDE